MADPDRPDAEQDERPPAGESSASRHDADAPASPPPHTDRTDGEAAEGSTGSGAGQASRPAEDAAAAKASVDEVVRELDLAERGGRLDIESLNTLRERLDELAELHVANQTGQVHDLLKLMSSKRRLMSVNFLAGLSRGVGFFLGVTLIGGLIIGSMAMAFDYAAASFGMPDITFSAIVRRMAEKSAEALDVWRSVQAERAEGPPENQLEPMPPAGGEGGDPALQGASAQPPPDEDR